MCRRWGCTPPRMPEHRHYTPPAARMLPLGRRTIWKENRAVAREPVGAHVPAVGLYTSADARRTAVIEAASCQDVAIGEEDHLEVISGCGKGAGGGPCAGGGVVHLRGCQDICCCQRRQLPGCCHWGGGPSGSHLGLWQGSRWGPMCRRWGCTPPRMLEHRRCHSRQLPGCCHWGGGPSGRNIGLWQGSRQGSRWGPMCRRWGCTPLRMPGHRRCQSRQLPGCCHWGGGPSGRNIGLWQGSRWGPMCRRWGCTPPRMPEQRSLSIAASCQDVAIGEEDHLEVISGCGKGAGGGPCAGGGVVHLRGCQDTAVANAASCQDLATQCKGPCDVT